MRRRPASIALLAALAAGTLAPSSALAARAPITGTLDAKGMTVMAVAPDGTTASAKAASNGRFSVAAPGPRATLHLRDADGGYAGPVVIDRMNAKLGTTGVLAGAHLGAIDVRAGWALVRREPPRSRQARGLTVRLLRGVPAGANRLGLIRIKGAQTSATKAGQDADRDGIVNAFDVDDDGDLRLDNVDASGPGSASASDEDGSSGRARTLPTLEERRVTIFSNLKLALESSLNANAGVGSMSRAAVNAAMTGSQTLAIKVVPGDEVELDCGGLTYCSTGGSGRGLVESPLGGFDFPDDYDADGDGFGTIEEGPTGDFQLQTGAEFDEIGAGDTFIERVTAGTRSLQAPGMLNYTFTSTPAVTQWSDGTTNQAVSYPVAAGSPGTASSPAPVQANADGDIVLTFTLWRPQRPRIAPIEARWVDIGGLAYSVDVPNAPDGSGTAPGLCDGSTLSESDSSLTIEGEGLRDSASDRAADPANTISFTVNMTDCLGSGATWDVGETLQFDLQARTRDGDNAAQHLVFRRSA